MTIKWNRSNEGFAESKCGRFSITPLYCGTTRAQLYQIRDNKTGRKWTGDTQAILKEEAQDFIVKEATP